MDVFVLLCGDRHDVDRGFQGLGRLRIVSQNREGINIGANGKYNRLSLRQSPQRLSLNPDPVGRFDIKVFSKIFSTKLNLRLI